MSQTDEETLQRICEEVEAELDAGRVVGMLGYAKAVARRYAETVGASVPVDTKIEEERQRAIKENGELTGSPAPGSFYCHEALHMASFLCSAIDTELCGHPAILSNPEWHRMAMEAHQRLADLYQMIGSAHLPAEPPPTA